MIYWTLFALSIIGYAFYIAVMAFRDAKANQIQWEAECKEAQDWVDQENAKQLYQLRIYTKDREIWRTSPVYPDWTVYWKAIVKRTSHANATKMAMDILAGKGVTMGNTHIPHHMVAQIEVVEVE